jgi:hypothetical protein
VSPGVAAAILVPPGIVDIAAAGRATRNVEIYWKRRLNPN